LDILCENGTMRNGGGYILQKHCHIFFLEVWSGTIATIFLKFKFHQFIEFICESKDLLKKNLIWTFYVEVAPWKVEGGAFS